MNTIRPVNLGIRLSRYYCNYYSLLPRQRHNYIIPSSSIRFSSSVGKSLYTAIDTDTDTDTDIDMEVTEFATPARCYADFCLIPVGTGNVSVAEEVAAVQKLLQVSGLTYTMHSAGTTVEGSWDDVMRVIGQAHSLVHAKGVLRVQSSMRVGTRTDKAQTAQDKVKRVEDILAAEAE
ncbi:YkoF-like protein [Hypoxylon fragiforme]|uniref:YkoF-like protein n=1 Tax=Hypoxylon fragiforme TaxID=63214 RepID=UPI0020C6B2C5|nr:YkoF-like protein [Hypoxylon fragiforme]KAI2613159.1 YkoF-like protein [Hypoxylon fragiforme]